MVEAKDNVDGFNGNWSCPSTVTKGNQWVFKCGRYLPKAAPGNNYAFDYRFAPDEVGGGDNAFRAPTYKVYIFDRAQGANALSRISETVYL